MTNLEKAKSIIKSNLNSARDGIFDSRNIVGDPMFCLYGSDNLRIDICYHWGYFEVFGLSKGEFEELEKYYRELCHETEKYF